MAGDSAGASQTGASSSGNQAADSPRRTLDDVMRSPSTNPPGVVVLDSVHTEKSRKNSLNPREDLWLSSADGRYNSPIIPLQVGIYPDAQTFYVHKNILIKTDYFRKALCGSFKEAATQSISLPEEDPAIFHFIVAFLYEDKYVPIKPIASALVPDEKGKGLSGDDELMTSDSDSSGAGDDAASDSSSARSRRRRARRRRREDRHWEINRQKHPGAHRIGCGCRQCLAGGGPPCWHCLAPRIPPPPPPVIPIHPVAPNVVVVNDGRRVRNNRPRDRSGIASPQPPNHRNSSSGDRIQGEDLRSWLLTYELNLDVYVCANKFLLEDFKQAIARCCIDMLESAGADAAQTKVLELCSKLFEGLPESDPLLKMVFARVGFLQPLLWRQVPDETSAFLLAHPEISALILKETATRRELDHGVSQLPPMERPFLPPPFDSPYARPIAPMHHRARCGLDEREMGIMNLMMKHIWWFAAIAIQCAFAQDLLASLDYGTFQGAYSAQYNISYWQKIPFAAPPIGENRFRAPQPPLRIENGTYNSTTTFDMCPQRTVNGSEDCLYLGLYGRPWSQGQPLRPVVVVFYGGAFIQGSASFTMPPSAYPVLNVSESSDMMFVYPNYRVNAFGFLPGREVADDPRSDVNAGLLDQDAAIKWTRRYIAQFGGDPEEISIWGQSAGGGSVLAQTIARPCDVQEKNERQQQKGTKEKMFKRALASSPFWPKTYRNDAPEAQARYDQLANLTGCATASDTLQCLKTVDVAMIRNASYAMVSGYLYGPTSYPWGPIIDGVFLTQPLSEVTQSQGDINAERFFSMYNTHEGENFVSSAVDYDAWIAGFLPSFSQAELARLDALYPAAGSAESIAAYNDSYTRAGLVYRDTVLACPAYWMAGAAAGGGWLGEYTISPAKHASDVSYWNTVNSLQQTDPLHYKGFAGAFASFFMTGDPNTLKLTAANVTGVPALQTEQEWVIDSQGFTDSNITQFVARCDFWREMAAKLPI